MFNPQDTVEISEGYSSEKRSMVGRSNEQVELSFSEMILDMNSLKILLEKETMYLKKMEIEDVKNMHDEKNRLIRKLEIQKTLIKRDPSLLKGWNENGIIALKSLSDSLSNIMVENYREVMKAKEVNQWVLEAIVNSVSKYEAKSGGYGINGMGNSGVLGNARNKHCSATSIALNQTI